MYVCMYIRMHVCVCVCAHYKVSREMARSEDAGPEFLYFANEARRVISLTNCGCRCDVPRQTDAHRSFFHSRTLSPQFIFYYPRSAPGSSRIPALEFVPPAFFLPPPHAPVVDGDSRRAVFKAGDFTKDEKRKKNTHTKKILAHLFVRRNRAPKFVLQLFPKSKWSLIFQKIIIWL